MDRPDAAPTGSQPSGFRGWISSPFTRLYITPRGISACRVFLIVCIGGAHVAPVAAVLAAAAADRTVGVDTFFQCQRAAIGNRRIKLNRFGRPPTCFATRRRLHPRSFALL